MTDDNGSHAQRGSTVGALTPFLRPKSVAIIGASDRSRWSLGAFSNLTGCGFDGAVHLVNRRGGTVHGRAAAESCRAIGERVDLGVVLVPAQAVSEAIGELGTSGVPAAIILTSGFAESGSAGLQLQYDIARAAAHNNVRLLGPNSLGLINFAGKAVIWTTPVRAPSKARGVAIISQSGATALFLATLAHQQEVGLSYVISTGNEADIDCTELIGALIDDPFTDAIALFIETVRNPAGFKSVASRALAAGKPIIVLKAGASEATARAATAHTGAFVGDDRVFDAICQQFAIIRVHSIEDLLATADIMARTGVLKPGGLSIISNSGGICEIAADRAHRSGLSVPPLSDGAVTALREVLPEYGTPHNPLDLTGGFQTAQGEAAVRILAGEPECAVVLCPWYEVPVREDDINPRLMEAYASLARGLNNAAAPGLLVSYTGTHVNAIGRRIIAQFSLPYVACGLDRAVKALACASLWSARQRNQSSMAAITRTLDVVTTERPDSESTALDFLRTHGVPVMPFSRAASRDEAVRAAAAFGGPVVLKIASPDIAHKSDIGGVAVNVAGEAAVAAAYDRIIDAATLRAPLARIDGVLVAPMRAQGVELLVGITRDPQWGPVLALGFGGIFVETLQDVALRLLPVGPADVLDMLAGLRAAKMLSGQRGMPAADLAKVAAAVCAIADAALRLGPELAALEVNPLWVRGADVEALDALCVWDVALADSGTHHSSGGSP